MKVKDWVWVIAEYSSNNGKTWSKYVTHMIENTLEEAIERIKVENKNLLFRNFGINIDVE